jgi:hemerythrin-like domain-containing protein
MSSRTVCHLAQEHTEIRNVLDAFESFLKKSETTDAPDRHQLWALLDALIESLFLRHEEKEETVLLPYLARLGLSWTDGTLAHVRSDHRHGRYLMRSLRQTVHQLSDWSSEERRHFLSIGHEWLEFLRHHMDREESMLFPFLDAQLDEKSDIELETQFASIDKDFAEMADSQQLAAGKDIFLRQYGCGAEVSAAP